MSDNVVSLVRPDATAEVVEVLAELLEQARSGQIRAFAMAAVFADCEIGSAVVGAEGTFSPLLASVVCMQHDMVQQARET